MPRKTQDLRDLLGPDNKPPGPLLDSDSPLATTHARSSGSLTAAYSHTKDRPTSAIYPQGLTGTPPSHHSAIMQSPSAIPRATIGKNYKRDHHKLEEGEYSEIVDGEVEQDQPRTKKIQSDSSTFRGTDSRALPCDFSLAPASQGPPRLLHANGPPTSGCSHPSSSPASSTHNALTSEDDPLHAKISGSTAVAPSASLAADLACDTCAALRAQIDLLQKRHLADLNTLREEDKNLRRMTRSRPTGSNTTSSDTISTTSSMASSASPTLAHHDELQRDSGLVVQLPDGDVESDAAGSRSHDKIPDHSTSPPINTASKRGDSARVNLGNGRDTCASAGTSALTSGINRIAVHSAAASSAALRRNPTGLARKPFRPSNFKLGELWHITNCAVSLDTRPANNPQTNKKCLQAEKGRIMVCTRPAVISDAGLRVLFVESAGGNGPNFHLIHQDIVFLLAPAENYDGGEAEYLRVIPADDQLPIREGSYLNIAKDYPVDYQENMTRYGALEPEDIDTLLDVWHHFKGPSGLYERQLRYRKERDRANKERDSLARDVKHYRQELLLSNDELHHANDTITSLRSQAQQHQNGRRSHFWSSRFG